MSVIAKVFTTRHSVFLFLLNIALLHFISAKEGDEKVLESEQDKEKEEKKSRFEIPTNLLEKLDTVGNVAEVYYTCVESAAANNQAFSYGKLGKREQKPEYKPAIEHLKKLDQGFQSSPLIERQISIGQQVKSDFDGAIAAIKQFKENAKGRWRLNTDDLLKKMVQKAHSPAYALIISSAEGKAKLLEAKLKQLGEIKKK
ncbi:hypothetical protein DdX_14855 [Ditylenchus destructor]|uniref:Uncharacterized protein n=1 Tax=Ditylenchus destructor TaxID=166010 RepID=A0AAD4MTQ5_9BILA|nr:hypothetical protein DdX_14855 [Ditylenchus destructor]